MIINSNNSSRITKINFIFTCTILFWMITPYFFRNISHVILFLFFCGWLFSYVLQNAKKHRFKIAYFYSIIWFTYIIFYKLLGVSAASWGNYFVQFFFWIGLIMGGCCYESYSNQEKKLLLMFIWILSMVNICDNIRLLKIYPMASTDMLREYGTKYLSMNVGDTNFSVYAALFFFFNLLCLVYRKKYRLFTLAGSIVSLVYIYLSGRATTFLVLGFVLVVWIVVAISHISKQNRKIRFLGVSVCFVIGIVLFFPIVLNYLIQLNPSSSVVARLEEISNMIYGTGFSTVNSGTSRLAFSLLSLKTWTSSLRNFIVGIGDGERDAIISVIFSNGIGQHSEAIDCLPRYGLVGTAIFMTAFINSLRISFIRCHKNEYLKWVYIGVFFYSFFNPLTTSSYMCVFPFIALPLFEQLYMKQEGKNEISNTD